jgi:hypothetical protein
MAIAATALWLAAATPAVAQSPGGPDAAPSSGSSSAPRPDPAPVKSKPAAPVAKRAARPVAVVTTRTPVQTTPAASATAPTPSATKSTPKRAHRTTAQHRRKKPARHAPAPHPAAVHVPALPHLTPVRLVAPSAAAGDASRARKLAAGALSLLILSLASAMLLAVAARGERRRVAR